jgi:hypothetical protein
MAEVYPNINFKAHNVIKAIDDHVSYNVDLGPDQVNQRVTPSNSGANSLSHQFVVPIASQTTGLNRRLVLRAKVRATIKYPEPIKPADSALQRYGSQAAFNRFPLMQALRHLSVNINSTSLNVNMDDHLMLLNMINPQRLFTMEQYTPVMPDNKRSYYEGLGDINNVMGGNNNTSYLYGVPRGGFPLESTSNQTVVGGMVTEEQLDIISAEPLLLSPFIFGQYSDRVLTNLNDLTVNMQFGNNVRPFKVSVDPALVGDDDYENWKDAQITISLPETPEIISTQYQMLAMIPTTCVSNYYEFNLQARQTLSSLNTVETSLNTFTVNSIPDKIVIVAKNKESSVTNFSSNHFVPIQNLSIQVGERANRANNFTKQYLYEISRKNGYMLNYLQWLGQVNESESGNHKDVATSGGFLVIDPSRDLGIDPNLSSGSQGNFSIDVRVTTAFKDGLGGCKSAIDTNDRFVATDYEVSVYVLNSGFISFSGGTSMVQLKSILNQGIVSGLRSEKAKGGAGDHYDDAEERMLGGGFMDFVKSTLKNAYTAAKPYLKQAALDCGDAAISSVAQGREDARELHEQAQQQRQIQGRGITGGRRNPMMKYVYQ